MTDADISKYISFEVIPVTTTDIVGKAVSSAYIGKVVEKGSASKSSITRYKVKNGEIVDPFDYPMTGNLYSAQQNRSRHDKIWELVKKLIPERYLGLLGEFMIFWGEVDDRRTLGYVSPVTNDLKTWRYAIAIDFAYNNNVFNGNGFLESTILHEFAHVLTLNGDQTYFLNPPSTSNTCDTYLSKILCTRQDSYIYDFFQTFWAGLWSDSTEQQMTANFINLTSRDHFVTGYASTNPDEDIAETYWHYVFNRNSQKSGSVAEKKVNFLMKFPELERIKDFQRDKLGLSNDDRSSRISPFSFYKTDYKDNHQGCVRTSQD